MTEIILAVLAIIIGRLWTLTQHEKRKIPIDWLLTDTHPHRLRGGFSMVRPQNLYYPDMDQNKEKRDKEATIPHEEVPLHCPGCGHNFTRSCPIIDNETIVHDDVCPLCGAQAIIND